MPPNSIDLPGNTQNQIIFAAACTWQKYVDPAALGGVRQ